MQLDRSREVHINTFNVRRCSWCGEKFKDGDKYYSLATISYLMLCENCKHWIMNPTDFSPEGTKEKGTNRWMVARDLIIWRDGSECRICGDRYETNNPIEVHHIIPRKDGGSNHPKNLITLCLKHHTETYKNGYGGLELTDRLVQVGKQSVLFDSQQTKENKINDK